MSNNILTVDTKGLSKIMSRNGINWIATELIQNAWDQNVSEVDMTVESVGHGKGKIVITDDDPEGFLDLTHAYTLFAESTKKGDPTLRGRFNLGEKLVIAYCIETGGEVEILTTTGGFHFSKKDGRKKLRRKTDAGSKVTAVFRAARDSLQAVEDHLRSFIAPSAFPTLVNGERLAKKVLVTSIEATLPTVDVNEDGDLYRTSRKTSVEIYKPETDETPMIYEMGIPVVENPTPYHINVGQKVPLNMERDAVTPAYNRKLCALVANLTRDDLSEEEVRKPWVSEAMESDDIEEETVAEVLDKKHGKKRLMHDPSNPESSAAAVAAGYAVVYGGSWSKKAHENIRELAPIRPATSKFKDASVAFSEHGKNVTIDVSKWSSDMRKVAEYTQWLHLQVWDRIIDVQWLNDPRSYSACYGDGIAFNKRRLGAKWIEAVVFSDKGFEKYLDIVIHEFSHRLAESHYSDKFHDEMSRIGAKIAMIIAEHGTPLSPRDKDAPECRNWGK